MGVRDIKTSRNPLSNQENVMKAWIMRVLAAIAVASALSACAGMGDASNVPDTPIYETTPSD
jgi:hypothetical protein